MKVMILITVLVTFVACGDKSKLDSSKNIAKANILAMYPNAKCDDGFLEPEIHSVRCLIPNGVALYCTASMAGWGCSTLPTEVQQQQEAAARQAAQQAPTPQPVAQPTSPPSPPPGMPVTPPVPQPMPQPQLAPQPTPPVPNPPRK